MSLLGPKKTQIPYDMFDFERDATAARRFVKCRNIYDKGQELAWNGDEILRSLLEKHGGVHIGGVKKKALRQLFAIIMWGEMAAWKVSAQLADQLEPLEAKMAATSQAQDEARHFYVFYDYLKELDYMPERLHRAPQALLDLVLEADHPAYKLLGMQLLVETMALTIFQTIRQLEVEPVLTELLRYIEKDEARHVGLGMQYLPELIKDMSRGEVRKMLLFQARLLFWALWETKVIEDDFRTLGVDAKDVLDLAREKQVAAVSEAFKVMGPGYSAEESTVLQLVNAAGEFLFPGPENRSILSRFDSAWSAFREKQKIDLHAFDVHEHEIRTARGTVTR